MVVNFTMLLATQTIQDTPRAVRQQNRVMSPVGLGAKNNCAGEDQQQFIRPTRLYSVKWCDDLVNNEFEWVLKER
jgi:hypothetical protein